MASEKIFFREKFYPAHRGLRGTAEYLFHWLFADVYEVLNKENTFEYTEADFLRRAMETLGLPTDRVGSVVKLKWRRPLGRLVQGILRRLYGGDEHSRGVVWADLHPYKFGAGMYNYYENSNEKGSIVLNTREYREPTIHAVIRNLPLFNLILGIRPTDRIPVAFTQGDGRMQAEILAHEMMHANFRGISDTNRAYAKKIAQQCIDTGIYLGRSHASHFRKSTLRKNVIKEGSSIGVTQVDETFAYLGGIALTNRKLLERIQKTTLARIRKKIRLSLMQGRETVKEKHVGTPLQRAIGAVRAWKSRQPWSKEAKDAIETKLQEQFTPLTSDAAAGGRHLRGLQYGAQSAREPKGMDKILIELIGQQHGEGSLNSLIERSNEYLRLFTEQPSGFNPFLNYRFRYGLLRSLRIRRAKEVGSM